MQYNERNNARRLILQAKAKNLDFIVASLKQNATLKPLIEDTIATNKDIVTAVRNEIFAKRKKI